MRVLIVSNLYPPFYIGGEELGCCDVAQALQARGHSIQVLTSHSRANGTKDEENIHRFFQYDHPFIDRRSLRATLKGIVAEKRQMEKLVRLVARLKPDVMFCFGVSGLSDSSLKVLQRMGLPMLYYVSAPGLLREYRQLDPLEHYYQADASNVLIALGKRVLRRYTAAVIPRTLHSIRTEQLCFTSESLRRQYCGTAGLEAERAQVLYWGIEPIFFTPRESYARTPVRILYAGRVVPEKGVQTAVEMAQELAHGGMARPRPFLLDIVGDGEANYMAQLKEYVTAHQLTEVVHFLPRVPRAEMPRVYAEHDILVFPSIWQEPFALTILEAMASGIAIVGTLRGGSREILVDQENALTFEAENPRDLARQVAGLMDNPSLRERLARSGRALVARQYTLEAMVTALEDQLRALVTAHGTPRVA